MTQSVRAVREIAIDKLTVSEYQIRKREIHRDLSELVENIRIHGQLEPILVAPTADSAQFEIIAGQRRWLAMKELGYESINATILHKTVDEATARALSISENMIRHDVGSKDLIDACTNLYRKYGSVKAVAEDLGLPHNKVRNFVKFDRLRPALKKEVERGDLDIKTAIKAEDYCNETHAGAAEIEKILHDIKDMTNAQRSDYFRSSQKNDEIGSASDQSAPTNGQQKPGDIHQILVTLLREDYGTLREWATHRNLTQDQAAARIISGFFRGQQHGVAGP